MSVDTVNIVLTVILPLVFGVIALVVFLRRRQPLLASFGLSIDRTTPLDLVVGLVIPGIALSVVFLVEWALGAITVTGGTVTLTNVWSMVGLLIFGAVFEEVTFRMMLVNALDALLRPRPWARWAIVAVTAAAFGAAHLLNPGATAITAFGTALGGVIYAVAFLATRRVWLPLALHFSGTSPRRCSASRSAGTPSPVCSPQPPPDPLCSTEAPTAPRPGCPACSRGP